MKDTLLQKYFVYNLSQLMLVKVDLLDYILAFINVIYFINY